MEQKLIHIGTVELVSLPDDRIHDVPAKVDTGADSSAIWASNIELKDGKLHFNFFAPGSAYYRKKRIVTTAFKTTSVKNSFGHEEFRYKIRIKVQIGEHTFTRWFSLADRSRNTYPILLGKNFLKNRFVVDVARKYAVSRAATNHVLVLGGQPELTAEFFDKVGELNALPVEYDCASYEQIGFYAAGSSVKVVNLQNRKDLADYTLIYFKSHMKHPEFAAAIAEYLRFKSRPFLDHEPAHYVSTGKLSEYMRLTCLGLSLPPFVCARTRQLKTGYADVVARLGSPFVLKEIASDRGRNNYLIDNEKDFRAVLDKAAPEHIFLAQKYIENDGFYRLYVLGKEVALVVWRTPHIHKDRQKRHLNKPAGSANASLVEPNELPSEARAMAVQAAINLDRQIAGVDILEDKHTKKWYILEVNSAPQIRGGSFVDEKAAAIARYFDKELSK